MHFTILFSSKKDEWGKLCCEVRGYPSNDYIGLTVGYFNPMATSGALACLVQTYKELVENGKPRDPIAIRTVGDQQVLDVFPYWRLDKVWWHFQYCFIDILLFVSGCFLKNRFCMLDANLNFSLSQESQLNVLQI